jgi:alpha-glucosidase (family GH31 glycosyl hydrolase)
MRAWPVLCCLAACSEPTLSAGGFKLVARNEGFAVVSPDGGVLLESATGLSGAYAPIAVRTTKARIEEQFGAFRITEGNDAWTEARHVTFAADHATIDNVATLTVTSPSDGVVALKVEAMGVNRLSLAFACHDDDVFAGFGEQTDALNHHGHTIPIWTSEEGIGKDLTSDDPPQLWFLEGARHSTSYGLPTWLSNRGFIAAVDFDGHTRFELCSVQSSAFRVEAWTPSFTLWLYTGTPAQALERATAGVLGRPPRPPAIAFAPWNDAIFGDANVRRVASELRDAGVPSSVIWTEDFRGGGDVAGSTGGTNYRLKEEWDIDLTLYPNPGGLAADLNDAGFQWWAYFNTFIVDGTSVADEAHDGGFYVSDGGAPYEFAGVTFVPSGMTDLSNPAAREWMKQHMRRAMDQGFDGWMADFGEWLPADAALFSGEDPLLAHNRYPREWMKLNNEVQAERAADGKPRMFFARSGWLGSTALTPAVWPGDQRTDFEPDDGMPIVIPMGIGLGLGGVSTFGSDIAGYQSSTNPTSTKELFFRWTELGALSPVMRTHHGLSAHDNWRFDSDAETLAFYARWADFHIRLFPYLDGASVDAETKGLPLMRALPLVAPDDVAGWSIYDEFGLGPAFLVAPVQVQGATDRMVHVPPGRWVSANDAGVFDGPMDVRVSAAVDELPLWLRAGSIVPRLPDGVTTLLGSITTDRELWIVPGGDGSFTERDGTTYTLHQDASAQLTLPMCTGAERGCVAGDVIRLSGNALSAYGTTLTIAPATPRQVDVRYLR